MNREHDGAEDLEVRTTQHEDICVIALSGELNVFNLKKAEAAVTKVIHNGRANVVFDLSGLHYVDSSGVGFFTGAVKNLYEKGGDLKIVHLSPYVQRIFQVLHLDYFLDVYGELADALEDFRANVARAVFKWRKVVELKPNYADAYYNLAVAYKNSGLLDEAWAEVEKALSINGRYVEALNLRGEILLKRKAADEAITVFKDVLALSPHNLPALLNLALCYGDINMLDEAIERYRNALALYPGYADTYAGLGNALLRKGESDEAAVNLQKAVDLNPNYLEAYRLLAKVHVKRGRSEEAIAALARVIDLSLDETEVREAQKSIAALRVASTPSRAGRGATVEERGGGKVAP